jgi:hypothetical protein
MSNNLLPERKRCRAFAVIYYLRGTGAGGLQWSPTWEGQVHEVCNDLLPERNRCRRFAMISYLRGTGAGGSQWSPTWGGQVQGFCSDLLPERNRCRRFAMISYPERDRCRGFAMNSYLRGIGAGGLQWSLTWEGQVQEDCSDLHTLGGQVQEVRWSPTWEGQVQGVCNDLLPERVRCRGFTTISYLRGTSSGGLQRSPTWEG